MPGRTVTVYLSDEEIAHLTARGGPTHLRTLLRGDMGKASVPAAAPKGVARTPEKPAKQERRSVSHFDPDE